MEKEKIEALYKDYYDNYVDAYRAASLRHINDIIEPNETRIALIKSFSLIKEKRAVRPEKKHGNIPL